MIFGGQGYTLEFQGVSMMAAYPLIKQPSHGKSNKTINVHEISWLFHEKDESQLPIYMEISMEIFTSPWIRLFISGVGPKKNKMRQRHCSWSKDNKARTSKARSATWYQPEIPRMEPSVLTNSREWNITIFHRRLRYIFYIMVIYISIVTLVFWGVTITGPKHLTRYF